MGIILIEYKVDAFQLINKNNLTQLGLLKPDQDRLCQVLSKFENSWWLWLFSMSPLLNIGLCGAAMLLLCFTLIIPVVALVAIFCLLLCPKSYYSIIYRKIRSLGHLSETEINQICPEAKAEFVMKGSFEIKRLSDSPSTFIYFKFYSRDEVSAKPDAISRVSNRNLITEDHPIGEVEEIFVSPKLESVNTRANNRMFSDGYKESPDVQRRQRTVNQIRGTLISDSVQPQMRGSKTLPQIEVFMSKSDHHSDHSLPYQSNGLSRNEKNLEDSRAIKLNFFSNVKQGETSIEQHHAGIEPTSHRLNQGYLSNSPYNTDRSDISFRPGNTPKFTHN